MNVIAVMPVKGRLPLLKHVIERLVRQGVKVICAGHTNEEKNICESSGAEFLTVETNIKLGAKWQLCVNRARSYKPDALMIMGSSDMVSDNWIETLSVKITEGYMMAGTEDVYYLDIQPRNKKRAIHWKGYVGPRKGELVGTGRMINSKALDLINWRLINPNIDLGIDASMMKNLMLTRHRFKKFIYTGKDQSCLSISTYKWANLHNFNAESSYPTSGTANVELIDNMFPEIKNLFNENNDQQIIIPYTVNVGNYDLPRYDMICFTDYNRFINSERNSRIYFILPHKFIDCDISILVSCEVQVKIPYEQFVKEWLGDADMALFKHPWRDCVLEEIKAAECRMKSTDELNILRAQGEHYRNIGIPEHIGNLPETAIIIRRHNDRVKRFCEAWWAEMCCHSYRDQCSFPVVLRDFPDLKVNFIEPDVRVHPYTEIGTHLK
jgi:hypothetical protein